MCQRHSLHVAKTPSKLAPDIEVFNMLPWCAHMGLLAGTRSRVVHRCSGRASCWCQCGVRRCAFCCGARALRRSAAGAHCCHLPGERKFTQSMEVVRKLSWTEHLLRHVQSGAENKHRPWRRLQPRPAPMLPRPLLVLSVRAILGKRALLIACNLAKSVSYNMSFAKGDNNHWHGL